MSTPTPLSPKFHALIDYEDPYVQPLILSALSNRLPESSYTLIPSLSSLPTPSSPVLQFRQYEAIDFDHLLAHAPSSLANSYIIRKALIRKHYLSTTVTNWITKYPESALKSHVKPAVEFEVDYAEFLDEALVEAWELKESWARNEGLGDEEKEWWILKPGMSERGQGIRLFSSEEELTRIFEGWEDDEEEEEDEEEDEDARSDQGDAGVEANKTKPQGTGIITSQLRHFIAQQYIHPPLLLKLPQDKDTPPRKFHIRTYVLSVGALKVYVYKPMLALFAARPYTAPSDLSGAVIQNSDEALRAHLTNTCLQDSNEREGSVELFWMLPDELTELNSNLNLKSKLKATSSSPLSPPPSWKQSIFTQILTTTSEIFEAAARSMSIHFQPLPNGFEIYGLDFLVDADLNVWLLEVNAFPDFRQTGEDCKGVVEGLFMGVVDKAVAPFFGVDGVDGERGGEKEEGDMVKVLDVDLGRR